MFHTLKLLQLRANRMKVITCMPNTYKSHCDGCPYAGEHHLLPHEKSSRSAPLSMENNRASVLLIFQAPGVDEWKTGLPISSEAAGSTGKRLVEAFGKVGKTRKDFNITNCVQCFPGKRLATSSALSRDNPPAAEARVRCYQWLLEDIRAAQYKRIVVFGTVAKAVLLRHYKGDTEHFKFIKHPAGGLSSDVLLDALRPSQS